VIFKRPHSVEEVVSEKGAKKGGLLSARYLSDPISQQGCIFWLFFRAAELATSGRKGSCFHS
jgi:hypothetical protein